MYDSKLLKESLYNNGDFHLKFLCEAPSKIRFLKCLAVFT